MSLFGRVVCCLLVCPPLVCVAAGGSSSRDIAKKLNGKIVFLRGMELGDKLSFDAQGVLIGTDRPGPFAFSALKIEKVHESGAELEIKGNRVALVFQASSGFPSLKDIRYVPLQEPVEIAIAIDPARQGSADIAFQKVFAPGPQDVLSGMSPEAEKSALDSLGSTEPSSGAPNNSTPATGATRGGHSVNLTEISPPRLIYSVDPQYTTEARENRVEGVCIVSAIVDANGRPVHIRIVRPLDPGLNVEAITAVSQYRFAPAIYEGKPVSALIHLEVNFRIY
ncbi:MAG TPA: energy transducer TonB [Silvibacterium sp.]|nr:energy transducer TonB [Silvibacterium sp.]